MPDACLVFHDPWIKEAHDGDRYRRKCSDLIQASTLEAMTSQKSLPNLQRAEEFAKEYAELKKRFMAEWKVKEAERQTIPTTYPDEIKPKGNLVYKKSGKRGRVFTGPQLAKHNVQQSKRKKRQGGVDAERIRRHVSLGKEEDTQNHRGQMDQEESLMDHPSYDGDVAQHAGTSIVSPGGRDDLDLDLPIAVDSSSDEKFPGIDRLYSMSQGGRNIHSASGRVISASQIVPSSSAITTRASRGVLKPSKVQNEMESQE